MGRASKLKSRYCIECGRDLFHSFAAHHSKIAQVTAILGDKHFDENI